MSKATRKGAGQSTDWSHTHVYQELSKLRSCVYISFKDHWQMDSLWGARDPEWVSSEKNLRATSNRHRLSDCGQEFSVNEMHVSPRTCSAKVEQDLIQTRQSENMALEKVIDMLERVLMEHSSNAQATKENRRKSNLLRIAGLNDTPCLVCKDTSHSAFTHCKNHRLCFQCFSPDHPRNRCPKKKDASSPNQQSNWVIYVRGRIT